MADRSFAETKSLDQSFKSKTLVPQLVYDFVASFMEAACPTGLVIGREEILRTAEKGLKYNQLLARLEIFFFHDPKAGVGKAMPVACFSFEIDWEALRLAVNSGKQSIDFDLSRPLCEQVGGEVSHLAKLVRSVLSRYSDGLNATASYRYVKDALKTKEFEGRVDKYLGLSNASPASRDKFIAWRKEIEDSKMQIEKGETFTDISMQPSGLIGMLLRFVYRAPPK